MSAGFLISIAGHKRFGYGKSTYMYHQISNCFHGAIADMEDDLIEVKRLQKLVETHIMQHTNITEKQLKEAYITKKDWYIDSQDAIRLGVIDELTV